MLPHHRNRWKPKKKASVNAIEMLIATVLILIGFYLFDWWWNG
jgi:hypothetical protein